MRYFKNTHSFTNATLASTKGTTINMVADFVEDEGYEVILWPTINHDVKRFVVADELPTEPFPDLETMLMCNLDRFKKNNFSRLVTSVLLLLEEGEDLDDIDFGDKAGSIIVVRDNGLGFLRLYSLVVNYLIAINEFSSALALAVSSSGMSQSLVNLGEDFFNAFIAITDSNHVLLGYSRHVEPVDPVNKSLVKLKYHSRAILAEEAGDALLSEKILNQVETEVFTPHRDFPQALIAKPLRVNGHFAAYIVMCIDHKKVTKGMLDAFEMFTFYCDKLLKRRMGLMKRTESFHQNFLFHLLVDQTISSAFVQEQALALGLPTSAKFCLAFILWDDVYTMQLADFSDEITRIREGVLALQHDGGIVTLFYADSEEELGETMDAVFGAYPVEASSKIYVSDPYESLGETFCAFRSVLLIERYEGTIKKYRGGVEQRTLYFRDAFVFYWSDPNSDPMVRNFVSKYTLANKIIADDEEKNTDNMQIIMDYLTCDRRVSVVAENCHLHRNGVLYRIKKIQSAYHVDFEDYLSRQYLLTSMNIKMAMESASDVRTEEFPIPNDGNERPEMED